MSKLTKLHLEGFKKYKQHTVINFDSEINILIGDNDSGKSSILQALAVILKGKYSAYNVVNDNTYANFLNAELIDEFVNDKQHLEDYTRLPSFTLVVEFQLNNFPENQFFNGENVPDHVRNWEVSEEGIVFEYKFNEEFETEYAKYVNAYSTAEEFSIPFDLYSASWKTFRGSSYKARQDPFKSIFIDNDNWNGDPFNAFTKQIFNSLADNEKLSLRMNYREAVKSVQQSGKSDYTLRINPNTTNLETILDVANDQRVSLRHLGSGQENLVKTELALESRETELILIEEPENHLSAGNTRTQIQNIRQSISGSQLILTTHNSQIISRMGVENTIWIDSEGDNNVVTARKFDDLEPSFTHFFSKLDTLDFMRILSSKYVVLVEGAAEYILMETFLKNVVPDAASKVEVISYSGRYYDPFFALAKITGARTVIFTDNDHDQDRLNKIQEQNTVSENVRIYSGLDINTEWTFETAVYFKNQEKIENKKFSKRSIVQDEETYMRKHKTEVALQMIDRFENKELLIPDYIVNGIKWLLNDY